MATKLKQIVDAIRIEANNKIFQAIKDNFSENGVNIYFIDEPSRLEGRINYGSWDLIRAYGEYKDILFKISFSKSGHTFNVYGIQTGSMGADVLVKKLSKAKDVDVKQRLFDQIFLLGKDPTEEY